jgi:hypothetical protein
MLLHKLKSEWHMPWVSIMSPDAKSVRSRKQVKSKTPYNTSFLRERCKRMTSEFVSLSTLITRRATRNTVADITASLETEIIGGNHNIKFHN